MTGLRAALSIPTDSCPLAVASAGTDEPIGDVSWSRTDGGTVTEEFTAGPGFDPDAADLDVRTVFDDGDSRVYRFERDASPCLCHFIEQESYPIANVEADDGALVVTLHLGSRAELREVVSSLRERFGTVRLRYLLRAGPDADEADVVTVDRGRLTDRQREVLETAYEMGYFATPREANATAVADRLGIDVSTVTEHLAAAQSTLLSDLLAG